MAFRVEAQPTPQPVPLTIDQVWQQTALYSKAVKSQEYKVLGAREEIQQARSEKLPEITAAGQYARVTNLPEYENGITHAPTQYPVLHTYYTLGGEAYWNIYSGGRMNTAIEEKQVLGKMAEEEKAMTLSEIKLRAAAYLLDIEKGMQFRELTGKNIDDLQHQLDHIRQLQKNGVVLKSDVLRAELQLSRQKLSLDQIGNDIVIATQRLNILIGQDDSIPVVPADLPDADSLPPASIQQYLEEAGRNAHPGLIASQQKELRRLQVNAARASAMPRLGFFAQYQYAYPQILFYPYTAAVYGFGMAGVKASWSISSLYQNKHRVRAAQIESEREEVDHANVGDLTRQQVTAAWLRYKEALHRIAVARTNVAQATENNRIVNNTYFNQLSLVTDLLDANTQLLQTKFELTSARIAALLQYYQLQETIGNL